MQTNFDQSISQTNKKIEAKKEVSRIGSAVTFSNNKFVVNEDASCIKLTICCNFYNMTGCSYYELKPRKNNVATGDSLWFFFDSGHSGGFTQVIMLPCKKGDYFELYGQTMGYTGYINSNTYITVEVF